MSSDQDKNAPLLDDDHAYVIQSDQMSLQAPPSSSSSSSSSSAFGVWWSSFRKTLNVKVLLFCCGLLIASVGNSIFFKKMTNAMTNYPYFLSQLTTVVYVPIFFGIVAYEFSRGELNEETIQFPKRKFFWMGVFDSLSGVFMLFGGVHTSGSTQALLTNSVIPMTMGLSILILRTRYRLNQYLGALIILGGVSCVIVPQFLNGSNSDDKPLFNILFLIAMAPQAMSSVYKEVAFKGADDIGVNWLQAWVALFQLGFGFVLLPLNTLSFLGDSAVSWSDLPNALGNGAKCLVGVNSIFPSPISNTTAATCYVGDEISGIPQCDQCNQAFVPVLFYLLFNCFYNLFITLVIKYGSAALMFIVLTLKLPLVQMAFAIKFINDPPDSITVYTIFGLLLIICGLITYRYQKTAPPTTAAEDGIDGNGDGDGGDQKMKIEISFETQADNEHGHGHGDRSRSRSRSQLVSVSEDEGQLAVVDSMAGTTAGFSHSLPRSTSFGVSSQN